ncbi:hypothetical protein NL676_009297 [Syzygium grande]|nr:hypothetical protein NL676_009297 [Syzygium grande]
MLPSSATGESFGGGQYGGRPCLSQGAIPSSTFDNAYQGINSGMIPEIKYPLETGEIGARNFDGPEVLDVVEDDVEAGRINGPSETESEILETAF